MTNETVIADSGRHMAFSPPAAIANDAASAISRTTPSPISRMSLTARPVQMTVVPASHNHETTGGVPPIDRNADERVALPCPGE